MDVKKIRAVALLVYFHMSAYVSYATQVTTSRDDVFLTLNFEQSLSLIVLVTLNLEHRTLNGLCLLLA